MKRLLVSAGLALALACATARRPGPPPSSSVGRPLALALPDLSGRVVDVGALDGRVRVVDFWATWCEPCREALPTIDALQADLGPRGLSAYAVSVDETQGVILPFLARLPLSVPVLWDQGGAALAGLDARVMPVTVIVDRRGVIRHVHQGWRRGQEAQTRQEVLELLAERAR